jgi:hypothetical protein
MMPIPGMNLKRRLGYHSIQFILFLIAFSLSHHLYADTGQSLSGRILGSNKSTILIEIGVRIVQLKSGKSFLSKTDSAGCYQFNSLDAGMYTLSAQIDNLDYSLIGKIVIKPLSHLAACVAMTEAGNSLTLLKKKCECDEMPDDVAILGSPAASGLFLSEVDNTEDAAAYRP